MQIDLDAKLYDHHGQQVDDPNFKTVGTAIVYALIARANDDPPFSPQEVARWYELAFRARKGGKLEVTPEDVTHIRSRVSKLVGVWFAGQVLEYTDPKPRPAAVSR